MADIDHNAEAIHFLDDFNTEIAQPVPLVILVVRRIGYMITEPVRKCDVSNAAVIEVFEICEVAFDG